MRRVRLGLAAVAVVALGGVVWVARRGEFVLPAALVLEEPVIDLTASFDPGAIVAQAVDAPVHRGELQPGDQVRGAGRRMGVIAPPGARLRFAVTVPGEAALRFGIGVAGDRRRARDRAGVRFSITVDGRERYQRVVNPAARRADRRWFDDEVDLAGVAGRTVEIVLATDTERTGAPLAGRAAWTRMRVVRRTTHARQPAAPDRPNVLVLLVDTLRADRLGCYGATPSPSPALDRLAAGGLLFERATAQASWTLPSVASLMSGLHGRHHGALHAGQRTADAAGGREFLDEAFVTWAEQAAGAGITTVGVSANPLVSPATNLAQGFETFVDMPWDAAGSRWSTAAEINDVFLRWLAQNRAHRFVAYLHYMEPHDPYTPTPPDRPRPPADMSEAIARGWIRGAMRAINWQGAALLPGADIAYLRRLYDGEIRAWDTALGTLVAGLDRLGLGARTHIVVTADHGEEFQEHGHLTHGSHLYQESVHVPLVVTGPGILPGRRTDRAQGVDLYPTLLALLGLPVPAALPGRDLLATTTAPAIIAETGRGIGPQGEAVRLVAVQRDGWKLIHTPALARFELYDLAQDPGERVDRWGQVADGAALAALIADWHPAAAPAAPAAAAPEVEERLRALGYVE